MSIIAEVDGIGRLEFPDGTDPAVIQATVRKMVRQNTATERPSVVGTLQDSPVGGLVRGLRDPIDAGAQLLTRGLEAVAPSGSAFETWARGQRQNVENINRDAEADYKENWRRGKDHGLDIGRIGGNVAGTLAIPAGAVGTAATTAGRAAQAARAGGILGLFQPVNNPEDGFWSQKAGQSAISAVTAGLANPALEKAGAGLVKGAGKLKDMGSARLAWLTGESSDDGVRRIVQEALSKQGINFKDLTEQARTSLLKDAKAAMGKSGSLDPAALARAAAFKDIGIDDPLKAWVTRDPVDWTRTHSLAAVEGVGDNIQHMQSRLGEQLKGGVMSLRPSNAAPDAATLGENAVRGVQNVETAAKAKVDALYQAFRDNAPNVKGDGMRFVNNLSTKLDDAMVGGQLPTDFVSRIQKIASGEFPLTPSTLYQMQKAASAQSKGNPALGIFKSAVDDEMHAMADTATGGGKVALGEAFEILKSARSAAASRFSAQDAIPALKAVADGTLEPERFFTKFVQGGSVREVAGMWNALRGEPEAKAAIQAQMVDYLKTAAMGKGSIENASFSQAGFVNALEANGLKQKIKIILGEKELNKLTMLAKAAEAGIKAPAGNKANNSNTAGAVMSLLSKSTGLPFLGPLVTQPTQNLLRQIEAAGQRGGPGLLASKTNAWTPEMQESTRRIAGLLSGPLGLLSAGSVSR